MHKDLLNIRHALAPSTCLKHTYIINGILGEGGFGITYSGKNKATDKRVAIKEYFPTGLAVRQEQADAFLLYPVSRKKEELFLRGKQHFLNEAGILKEFQYLENIVSVYDVFEENNTAYIVMDYIEGLTLKQYIEENGYLSFTELLSLTAPVIQALSAIHKKKLIHRDISPDNLILGTDNQLHVIDFGAARHENITGGQHTVMLKSGYAPPEQYFSDSRTGAWVDVYALCATMYFALTGNPPSAAIHRLEQDSLDFPDTLTDLLPWQQAALEKGLHIRMSKRYQNMDELYDALTAAPESETQVTMTEISLTKKERQKIRHMRYRLKPPAALFLLLFLVPCAIIVVSVVTSHQKPANAPVSAIASPQIFSILPEALALPAPLSMPKLSGLSLNKAKQVLKNLDDTIHIETKEVYDSSTKKGEIISQNVVDGTLFSRGQLPTILLTISRGKKTKPSASSGDNKNAPEATSAPKTTPAQKTTPKATPMPNTKTTTKATPVPNTKTTPAPKTTQKPEKSTKKPSSGYHVTPEDDDFVTISLD